MQKMWNISTRKKKKHQKYLKESYTNDRSTQLAGDVDYVDYISAEE